MLDPRLPDSMARTRRLEEIAILDRDIVAAVLAGDIRREREIAVAKMELPNHFTPESIELRVLWLCPGDEFEVMADPSCETIRHKRGIKFWRA